MIPNSGSSVNSPFILFRPANLKSTLDMPLLLLLHSQGGSEVERRERGQLDSVVLFNIILHAATERVLRKGNNQEAQVVASCLPVPDYAAIAKARGLCR